MGSMSQELKVGLFFIFSLMVLGYIFFVLSPESLSSKKYDLYYSEFKDIAGVVPKTQVKTNGVVIGRVKSVKLGEESTKIFVEID